MHGLYDGPEGIYLFQVDMRHALPGEIFQNLLPGSDPHPFFGVGGKMVVGGHFLRQVGAVLSPAEPAIDAVLDDSATAGRNDLMAAVYLPYCGRFVSDDWAHRKDLRDIVPEAGLECEILSVAEFEASFTVA